jgi:hypothetical protein
VPRWYAFGKTAPHSIIDDSPDAVNRWRAADIDADFVAFDDTQIERFLPNSLGLRKLCAISLGKGCYPGQEIIARLHFKGGNKRWLHRLEFTAGELPASGTIVEVANDPAGGEILNAAWSDKPRGIALAVLPELAAGTVLRSASTPVTTFRVVSIIDRAND